MKVPVWFNIACSLVLLGIIVFLEQYTSIDVWVQSFFYTPEAKQWYITSAEHKNRFGIFFYYGIKQVLIYSGIIVTLSLCLFWKWIPVAFRIAIVKYILALILVPLCIASLKSITNMYCPSQLDIFGGKVPYVHLFDAYPATFPNPKGRCFPAGHATAGFLFLILFYCFQDIGLKKYRFLGLTIGLLLGWTTGLYQMLRGEHFLSHTLITMVLAWVLVVCINATVNVIVYKIRKSVF